MTGSSVPAVIDWLVANHPTSVGADMWVVSDGWPVSALPSRLVIVGSLTAPSADQSSHLEFLGAFNLHNQGSPTRLEDYLVTLEYRAVGGGADQKTLRDAVYAGKAAFESVLYQDFTLGGVVDGCAAELNSDSLQQTDADGAENGRFATLTSLLHVRNSY